jgi:hypothetical protein
MTNNKMWERESPQKIVGSTPSAHFQLFGGRQYIVKKTSRHQRLNRLTSINVNFVRPNDGDVDLIWRISAETTAKVSWGLVTPC